MNWLLFARYSFLGPDFLFQYPFSGLKEAVPEIPPAPLCKGGLGGISAMRLSVHRDLIFFSKGGELFHPGSKSNCGFSRF